MLTNLAVNKGEISVFGGDQLRPNVNINDIDYRLNNLNRNVNMLIKKMNDSDFFDDESQDNIHDLVLFILFGVFMIFVLDTIYKLGRKN